MDAQTPNRVKIFDPESRYFGETGTILKAATSDDSRTVIEFANGDRGWFNAPYWAPFDVEGYVDPLGRVIGDVIVSRETGEELTIVDVRPGRFTAEYSVRSNAPTESTADSEWMSSPLFEHH